MPISLRYIPMESLIRTVPTRRRRPAFPPRKFRPDSARSDDPARRSDLRSGRHEREERSVTRQRRGRDGSTVTDDVIVLDGVRKEFGTFVAVERADFSIARGEFFSLLGPSGCGKTTLLKMIAGFELPTSGRVHARGRRRLRRPAAQAQRQHRLPAVRAVPAHVGVRQRGVRPAGEEGAGGRGPPPGDGDARRRPPRRVRRPPPGAAVRRPAAARRPGPGARQPARAPCCSTSRSPRSTSSSARRCRSSSSGSSARSGSRSSSSPTTRARRSR